MGKITVVTDSSKQRNNWADVVILIGFYIVVYLALFLGWLLSFVGFNRLYNWSLEQTEDIEDDEEEKEGEEL